MEIEHRITRTKAEQKIAKALNKEQIRFQQNYRLAGYEVDFWIAEAGLVIEVDGFSHLSNKKIDSDQVKDRRLREKGYTVVRYNNQQVYYNIEQCVNEIKTLILKIKSYCPKVDDSLNSAWKEALKPVKQKIKSSERKDKEQPTIEAYFLSLDQEVD